MNQLTTRPLSFNVGGNFNPLASWPVCQLASWQVSKRISGATGLYGPWIKGNLGKGSGCWLFLVHRIN